MSSSGSIALASTRVSASLRKAGWLSTSSSCAVRCPAAATRSAEVKGGESFATSSSIAGSGADIGMFLQSERVG
eukprot:3649828-Pyramimonas_sp.AAC.1